MLFMTAIFDIVT